MDYKEVVFTLTSTEGFYQDLLINSLAEAGFDTFEETGSGFKAYIPAAAFDEQSLKSIILSYQDNLSASYVINDIPHKNWNEVWESSFEPIIVSGKCYVRAGFHEPRPDFPYEIIINPKMAFGTGHHQTTALMMEFMLEEDLKEKSVLDMGSGTGILAILAEKLGAASLTAIDNDPVCYDSILENAALNNVYSIKALLGSKEIIPDTRFDIIFANINRNILLDHLSSYSNALDPGGLLYLSGFYETDLDILKAQAENNKLDYTGSKMLNNWVAARFLKRK